MNGVDKAYVYFDPKSLVHKKLEDLSESAVYESFDRKDLILPAILVGSLGNALGTYLGFLVIYIL